MSDLQQEKEAFFAEYTERWNNQDDYSSLIENLGPIHQAK